MPLQVILIFAIMSWQAQAQAQSCLDIYNTIKKEAMYCGFYCDQKILEPLQQVYEEKCISLVIPISSFEIRPWPQQVTVFNDKTPEVTAPDSEQYFLTAPH